jgi:hypothetical protein
VFDCGDHLACSALQPSDDEQLSRVDAFHPRVAHATAEGQRLLRHFLGALEIAAQGRK